MRLEVRFFSAVPGSPPRPCVGLLVVDFDETLTEADTTPRIIAAAVSAAEASASGAATCCLWIHPLTCEEADSAWRCSAVSATGQEQVPDALAARAAGELKAKVRQEREALRDRLVANYARERDTLLAAELPAVRRWWWAGQWVASLPALAGSVRHKPQGSFVPSCRECTAGCATACGACPRAELGLARTAGTLCKQLPEGYGVHVSWRVLCLIGASQASSGLDRAAGPR
jgi:hypothetical protein